MSTRPTPDELVAIREGYRRAKDWAASDAVRADLDAMGVYVFDEKDGSTTVWHCPDAYFKHMNKAGFPQHATRRAYVEYRMRQDRQAEARCDAWMVSMRPSLKRNAHLGSPLLPAVDPPPAGGIVDTMDLKK